MTYSLHDGLGWKSIINTYAKSRRKPKYAKMFRWKITTGAMKKAWKRSVLVIQFVLLRILGCDLKYK